MDRELGHKMSTTNRIVWISYRRRDRPEIAERIRDRLADAFDRDLQIQTGDHVPAGVLFVEYIAKQVSQCLALIVIIGPDWLGAEYSDGRRQLDDPWDTVSLEISSALQSNISVLPIVIDGARVPSPQQLPERLKPLVMRNAIAIRQNNFDDDVVGLERLYRVPLIRTRAPIDAIR